MVYYGKDIDDNILNKMKLYYKNSHYFIEIKRYLQWSNDNAKMTNWNVNTNELAILGLSIYCFVLY